jgi:class 3 adenylate cyclase/hemoglobin-like flavoprotein
VTQSGRARVVYFSDARTADVEAPSQTILRISQSHRVPHMSECGGHARCTTCRVRVLDGLANLSPRTDAERAIAEERGWDAFTRLACQTRVFGDVIVERIIRSAADAARMRVEESNLQRGRELSLAIMFCDLRGFTPLTERHLPYDVVHLLNRYFEAVGEPILNNNGYIDMYIGDALVAHYGLDGASPSRTCLDAVRSALLMQQGLADLNRRVLTEFGISLAMGIGVHFGTAIVGPIGHSSKLQLTAIGDSVNVASRIESATKDLGAPVLVSDDFLEHVRHLVKSPRAFDVELKGKSGQTRLHEVTGLVMQDPVLLVQSTLAEVARDGARFGKRFYETLFSMAPGTRVLFTTTPLELQERMFVEMLFLAVRSLSRLDELSPALVDLGARHVGYGAVKAHFALVKRALIATLREALGPRMTPEAEAAWSETYDVMTTSMLKGMKAARAAAAGE